MIKERAKEILLGSNISNTLITCSSLVLMLAGIITFVLGVANGSNNSTMITEEFVVFLSGAIIFCRDKLTKIKSTEESTHKLISTNNSSVEFFGTHIDLVVTQMVIIFTLIIFHFNTHVQLGRLVLIFDDSFTFDIFGKFISVQNSSIAIYVAILGVIISVLLLLRGEGTFGVITSFINIIYIIYTYSEGDPSFSASLERYSSLMTREHALINISPYIFILILSIAFPIIQLVRIGSLKYGNLYGDKELRFANHNVFLPIGSAFFFYILLFGGYIFVLMSKYYIGKLIF